MSENPILGSFSLSPEMNAQVFGQLTSHDGQYVLKLGGGKETYEIFCHPDVHPAIYGSLAANPVSLLDVKPTRCIRNPESWTAEFVVRMAIYGDHIKSISEVSVREISFQLIGYETWDMFRPLVRSVNSADKLELIYEKPPLESYRIGNGRSLQIGRAARFQSQRGKKTIARLDEETTHTIIYHDKLASCETAVGDVMLFTRLIELIRDETCGLEAVKLKDEKGEVRRIVAKWAVGPSGPGWVPLIGPDDVKAHFSDILARWFALYEELRIGLDFFFAATNSGVSNEMRFSSSVMALEGFHRALVEPRRSRKDRKSEIEAIKRKTSGVLQDSERDLLARQLQHAHEPSLAERLTEISELYEPYLREIMPQQFRRQVVATRNYLAHHLKKSRQCFTGSEYFYAGRRLSLAYKLCLLTELGLPDTVTRRTSDDYFRRIEQNMLGEWGSW